MKELLLNIAERKTHHEQHIQVCHRIGADPYDEVARWKEMEWIEKQIAKFLKRLNKPGKGEPHDELHIASVQPETGKGTEHSAN